MNEKYYCWRVSCPDMQENLVENTTLSLSGEWIEKEKLGDEWLVGWVKRYFNDASIKSRTNNVPLGNCYLFFAKWTLFKVWLTWCSFLFGTILYLITSFNTCAKWYVNLNHTSFYLRVLILFFFLYVSAVLYIIIIHFITVNNNKIIYNTLNVLFLITPYLYLFSTT